MLADPSCQFAGLELLMLKLECLRCAAAVSEEASPTKGVRIYDALKAKRWHPGFRLQDVSIAAVRQTLDAARCSPLWAAGGKKAPSTAAIASGFRWLRSKSTSRGVARMPCALREVSPRHQYGT